MYEDFPSSSHVTVEGIPSAVGRIAHELEALQAAQLVAEQDGDPAEARLLCRTYLCQLDPETIEDRVVEASIQKILGQQVSLIVCEPIQDTTWEAFVAETLAQAWISWAAGDDASALATVDRLRTTQKAKETFLDESGAVHLLTLSFWSEAVLLLVAGDRPDARRFFKRAIEMGAQFGTDSHPMISWAYASSFFED